MEEHTLSRPRTTHLPQALGWGSGGGGRRGTWGDSPRRTAGEKARAAEAGQGGRPTSHTQEPMPGAAEGPARRPRHCSAPDTGKDQAATPGKAWVGRRGQRP